MKIKTSELAGAALDWAVGMAIGEYKPVAVPSYSTDWSQGGPIIEREEISMSREFTSAWAAWASAPIRDEAEAFGYGPTPLIAAMRCYVASKLGDEVEVPDEVAA
jgi:hypothetical protein